MSRVDLVIVIAAALSAARVVVYVLSCWLWPFAACRRCDGSGRHRSPSGRAFRLCRRCKGSGRRLRLGRLVYNRLTEARREAQ